MKPSGIEWIGDIPDDWEVRRLKGLGEQTIGLTYSPQDITDNSGTLVLRSSNIQNGKLVLDRDDNVYVSIDVENKILKDEDILICSRNGSRNLVGKTAFVITYGKKLSYGAFTTIFRSKYNKFLFYVFNAGVFEYHLASYNTSTINQLTTSMLNEIRVPFPPVKTQQKIADYLDEKCGEIDATISKQKESIEKLKAYKQSLISETVTKGLDKSAPLKPSGIEWIGDIPAHWEVCKIKNHCNLKTGSTPSSKDLSMFDGAENWFTPSDFTENYMLKNSLRRLNAKVFDQNLVPIFPPLSVLIVGIGATTGKVGFTTSKSSSNQQITAIIPKDKNIFPKFLLFWMIANTKMIRETALFTTLPILNNDTLGNATLLIPPYKEQLELASYIENKNIEIDVIINKKQNIIQKLDAYKKSIIFECVTGKKRI